MSEPLAADLVRRGWAFRCLREAKAELEVAKKMPVSAAAVGTVLSAMRRAQAAIYYALGSPSFIGPRIHWMVVRKEQPPDKLSDCLMRLERIIQSRATELGKLSRTDMIREADRFIQIATEMVNFFVERGFA